MTRGGRAPWLALSAIVLASPGCGLWRRTASTYFDGLTERLIAERLAPTACARSASSAHTVRLPRVIAPTVQPTDSSCWAAVLDMSAAYYGGELSSTDYVERFRRAKMLESPTSEELRYWRLFAITSIPLYRKTAPPPNDLTLSLTQIDLSKTEPLSDALADGRPLVIIRELETVQGAIRHMSIVDGATFEGNTPRKLLSLEGIDPANGERFQTSCLTLAQERTIAFRVEKGSAMKRRCRKLRRFGDSSDDLEICERFGW